MAAGDATPFCVKNQAFRVTFPIFDADGDLVTGATGLDSEVSKDAGTFADCTNEATEIATSSGIYYLDLTATEMNADTVTVIVKTSSSGAKTTPIVLYPATATRGLTGTAVPAAAADAAGGLPISDAGGLDLDARLDAAVSSRLAPTTAGRTLDVTAGGCAGIDWANVEAPTTTVGLTGTTIATTQVVASVSGAVGSVSGLTASDVGAIKTRVELALPAVAPAANGGLGTVDASNYIAGIAGTKNQLDDLNDLAAAGVRTAVGLASANLDTQLDALPTAAENAAALLDLSNGIETSITPRQAIRLILASAAGKLSGAATTTIVIRNVGDSKDRITATVDADGNRTAVTTDAT